MKSFVKIVEQTVGVVRGSADSGYRECRTCGGQVEAAVDRCPTCGSESIAEFEF